MSDPQPKASFSDLPPEILLERLLPVLEIKDLLSLSQTNKTLHSICNDESHWLHRTRLTFSYNPHTLAPASPGSGWSKRLYIGLSRPEPYVWGSADNDRLGLPEMRGPQGGRVVRYSRKVTRPESLAGQFGGKGRRWVERLGGDLREERERIAGSVVGAERRNLEQEGQGGVGIVEMHAGGWSFAARDMQGRAWVWGQLDGDLPAFRSASWADKHERVPEPTPIPLPCRAEAISVGRCHMMILDEDNLIWEMRDWGRAYHHTSPALTSPANPGSTRRPHHIVQLSTGWSHSACLTSSGKIYVWYPFSGAYTAGLTHEENMNGPLGVKEDGDESRAVKWGTVGGDVVVELEGLPERPHWEDLGHLGDELKAKAAEWDAWDSNQGIEAKDEAERVVKIASGQGFVVALKANGEVWFRLVQESREFDWEYLIHFSSPQVSHISAQFTSLTSYSTSTPSRVYHARLPADTEHREFGRRFRPDPLPGLQGKGVIQVAIGDYHFAALTSQGEMWTWGQGSAGQLGLGYLGTRGEVVTEPKRVEFGSAAGQAEEGQGTGGEDAVGKMFVFAITASGWHTGALVLGGTARTKRENEKIPTGQTLRNEADGYTFQNGSEIAMPGAFPTTRPQSVSRTTAIPPAPRPGGPILSLGMPQFRIGLAGGHPMGIQAGLEPQLSGAADAGGQQIPMPDQVSGQDQGQGQGSAVQGQGSRPERNWLKSSKRDQGGSIDPPCKKRDGI